MGALADDILNIPYIDSDNMDEYLKILASRADELEIKRDNIKQLLNMRYGVPKLEFDPEKHKEWLYDKFNVKPMDVHMDLMQIINRVHEETDNFIFETIQPWCEERVQRKVSKADLEQALLMYYSLDKDKEQ